MGTPEVVHVEAAREEAQPTIVTSPEPAAEAPEAAPSPAAASYDPDAKATLRLRVVDPDGLPVPDAELKIGGMRSEAGGGSWYSYRGQEPTARSGPDGWASLEYVVWVDQDGELNAVALAVEHPEFVPFQDSSFSLEEGEVTLERGAMVVCSAWFRDEGKPILEVQIQADRQSRVGQSDWTKLSDGRLATTRFAPGAHAVTVAYDHPELGRLYSKPSLFEVGSVGWETLHLELVEPVRLMGELDPRVPRPVINGQVRVIFRGGGATHSAPLIRSWKDVPVQADGTFVLENARPGECFLFALSQGWTVKRMRPTTLLEAGIGLEGEVNSDTIRAALDELPASRFI